MRRDDPPSRLIGRAAAPDSGSPAALRALGGPVIPDATRIASGKVAARHAVPEG